MWARVLSSSLPQPGSRASRPRSVRIALVCLALVVPLGLPLSPASAAVTFGDDAAAGVATDASGAAAPKRGGFAPATSPVAGPAAAAPAAGTRSPAAADALPAASPFAAPGSRAPAVSKPFQPPSLIAPRVLGLYPNEFAQGTSYSVSLSGENLSPTLKVDFGAGILVKGAPVLLPGGKLKVSIEVLPFAASGKRRLKIGTVFAPPSEQLAEFQVVQKMVVAADSKPKVAPVKLPAANLDKVFKGVILLDAPAWRKQTGSQAPLKGPDGKPIGQPTPIYKNLQPTLDDTLLFIWHEQNKGVAERYEIRFFKGGKLLAKRSLPAPSGSGWGSIPHYRPDAALIGELFQQIGGKPAAAGGKTGKFGQPPVTAQAAQALNATQEGALPGNYQAALAQADIAWEVAGFRSYAKNGVAKSALADLPDAPVQLALAGGFAPQTSQSDAAQASYAQAKPEMVEMEVEISERWPLYLGAAPTGLACSSAMSAGLSLHNIDATTQNGQLAGASGFTFERFEIQGSLNLGKSSYAAHVDKTQASTPDTQTTMSTGFGGSITVGTPSQVLFTTWSFDNVFVDWGDGTQEALAATMGGDAGDYERGDAVNLNNSMIKYRHAYAAPGQYTVRLFQLGEDDIQGGGQQVAATAVDLGGNQNLMADAGAANLYNAAQGQSGGSQAKAAQAELEYGKAVADRAYMMFCQPLSIQRRTDPAANGPLKLVDISVGGVTTAADAPKAGAAKSGKVVAKPSLGAKDSINVAPSPGGGALAKADSATLALGKKQMNAVAAASYGKPSAAALALEKTQVNFNALAVLGGVPAYSACDYQLTPYGQLHYTGQGEVRTRWYVDGVALPPDAPRPVGPSQSRPDSMLKNPPATWGPPLVSSVSLPAQSPVGLEQLGQHNLRVEAEAVVDSVHLFETVGAALGGDGAAHALLANAAKEGSLPKLGVLAPAKVPVKPGVPGGGGPGPVMNLLFNGPPLQLAMAGNNTVPVATVITDAPKAYELTTKKEPPRWAVSPLQPYVVLGHDAKQPCTFDFPVADGKFKVVGLQSPGGKPKVTRQGDRFSGQGDLIVPIPGGGTQKAPVNFQNWKVDQDGITVLEGQFSITAPGLPELVMPALKGRFTRLDGVAGQQVDAWLDAALSNSALPEAASATQVARWKGAKAALSPDGDWYADGLAMAEFLVYDSGFRIKPQAVALDLSAKQGGVPGSQCQGGAGNAWRGISLGQSDLLFFNFDMPGAPPKAVVSDWGIDANGLCGKANSGPESHDWMRGKIGWKGVEAKAWNGIFKATYDDLWVHAPWLDATLTGTGDPVLLAGKGQGQGGIMLNLKGQPKTLKHGPITLRVDNLAFSKTQLGGGNDPVALPAVSADTCFDFQGEAQVFAKDVCFTGLYFAFDGQAYFQGAYNKTVSLSGQSGKIAQGTVSLKEVKVGTTGGGDQRLGFDFLTDLKISQALPAVPVPVSYRVSEPATAQYNGSGPVTGSFEVKFDSPLVKANIKPVYTGSQDGTSVASNPVLLALADLGYGSDAPFMVALGSGDSIVFKGEVDLTQFQSAIPLKGAFLLGYHGDTDFWATKFAASVPGGIVLVPGVVSLYEFGGGLGYHVTRDSLVGPSLDFVEFSPDSTPVLNATALVGTVDGGFIFAARGDLNIKPGGGDAGVDMAYTAWLLSSSHGGTGPIKGTLGYGGGAFYGTMGGKWGPPGLDSYVYVEAPANAIGFSIGGGEWYFRVGSKDSPVTGHILIVDAGSWFDLSSAGGLRVGARANKRFPDITCDGGTCAYVEGDILIDTGLQLNPARFDATGNYSVAAKGCLVGACVGVSEAVSAHAAAPNPYVLGFSYTLSGCPIGKLNVSLKVLPSIDPGVSADLCSFGEMGEAIASGAQDAWNAATGMAEDAYDAVTSCFGLC